jgi:hypothetical protein
MAKLIVAGDAVAGEVISGKRFSAGINYDAEGNVILPAEADVKNGVGYGAEGTEFEGTYGGGTADYPAESEVLNGVSFDNGNQTGDVILPLEGDVVSGINFGSQGTLEGNVKLPAETDVKLGVGYGSNETQYTGTLDGIPGDVITQLDVINGEVIGTTVYDKMDAIEAEKANILAAMNSAGFTAHTDDDLDTYAPYIAVDVIDATRGALDTIAGGTAPDPDDLQHSIWNVSDKMDDIRNEVANMYEVVSVPDNLTGIASEIATSNTSLLTDLNSNLGSVQTDINDAMSQLDTDRTAIHDAIEAKGVTVDAEFDDYAAAIANISGGGGAETITGMTISRPDADIGGSGLSTYGSGTGAYDRLNEAVFDGSNGVYRNEYYNNDWNNTDLHFSPPDIPLGATITAVRTVWKVLRNSNGGTDSFRLGIIPNGAAQFYYHTTLDNPTAGQWVTDSKEWLVNPYTNAAWKPAELGSPSQNNSFILRIEMRPTAAYPVHMYSAQVYMEIDWEYTKLAGDPQKTGVTVSQCTGDDGDLEKGNDFVAVDNGDGTVNLPNRNLMIAKPMNMIDGTDGAVNASNTVQSAYTLNYGTLALGTQYNVGQMVGLDPNFSGGYLPDWDSGSTPYSQGAFVKDPISGAVFQSLMGSNYDNPNNFLSAMTYNPSWVSWGLIKSHDAIYVCKTQHTTAAEPTQWEWTPGINYTVGDKRTYNDGMGGLYWECNTSYQTPNGWFYEDAANWTDITAATLAAAFVSANWQEVTNMACPMALGIPRHRITDDHCTYAGTLNYAGYSDWRLINARELMETMNFGGASSYAIPALGIGTAKQFQTSTPSIEGVTTHIHFSDFGYTYLLGSGFRDTPGFGLFVRDIE